MSMVLQSNTNNIAHKLAHLSFAITTQSINIQLISSVSDFSVMIIASRRTSGWNGTATVVCLFVSVTRGRTYKDYPVKIEISITFSLGDSLESFMGCWVVIERKLCLRI